MSNYQSGFTGAQIDAAVGGAVRFDVEQSRTNEEKARAQTNLGIGNVVEDVASLKSILTIDTEIKYIPSGVTGEGTQLDKAGYIDTSGSIQASSGYSSSDFIEIPASVSINPSCYGVTTILNVAFYDETKTFINGIGASSSWGRVSGNVDIPSNAKYFRLCLMNADTTGKINVTYTERYSTQEIEEVDNNINAISEKITKSYKIMVSDITGGMSGYVDSTGVFNSSASWIVTDFITCKNIIQISEHVNAYTTVPYAVYYDKYKVFIGYESVGSNGMTNVTLTVPEDAYYIRINMYVSDTTQYYQYTVDEKKTSALALEHETDPLWGRKIGAVGDSITIGTYSVPQQTYIYQIANAHNMSVDNRAIWGSVFPTGKTQGGNPQGSIYSQIADVASDCDAIIISGGINDADYWDTTGYWGEISGGYSATLDTTTFCGAFEATLKAALAKWKGKPILFVFEHRMTQKYQSDYGQHFEDVQFPLMVQMLEKWGIPYVDLFHDMPSIKLTPDYIELYSFDNQGVHPNVDGYRKFYVPRVESKLISIS